MYSKPDPMLRGRVFRPFEHEEQLFNGSCQMVEGDINKTSLAGRKNQRLKYTQFFLCSYPFRMLLDSSMC